MDKIKENAKGIAALVSLIVQALIVNGLSGPWEMEISVIGIIAGAIAVWAVPNQDPPEKLNLLLPPDPYPEGYHAAVAAEPDDPEDTLPSAA